MRRPYIPRNRSSARLHCASSAGDMWANGSLCSMLAASASLSGSRVGGSTRCLAELPAVQRCCPHWLVPPRTHLTQSPEGPTCRRGAFLVGESLLGCAIRSTPVWSFWLLRLLGPNVLRATFRSLEERVRQETAGFPLVSAGLPLALTAGLPLALDWSVLAADCFWWQSP